MRCDVDHEFWHNAWAKSEKPGWQQDQANNALVKFWQPDSSAVFVPLCGRSPDLTWLHEQGHQVIGVDLSETAIRRFLESGGQKFSVEEIGEFKVFRAHGYTLYAGAYFSLSTEQLSSVARVYDRAALVALPADMRPRYAEHLQNIVPASSQILMNLIAYDQSQMDGPPFSVPESEMRQYFEQRYQIEVLQQHDSDLKRRGLQHLVETTYRLTPV
jgi:thiopurine S-methyltransferase